MQVFRARVIELLRNGQSFWTICFGCIFFAFAGPFGSFDELSTPERLAFWVPVFLAAFVCTAVLYAVVAHFMPEEAVVRRRIVTFLLFTSVFTPMLYLFILSGPLSWGGMDLSFAVLASWVLLTAGTCTAIFAILNPDPLGLLEKHVSGAEEKDEEQQPPRLFRRIGKCAKQTSITRLTVNDHYVLVGLSDGSEQRLLMRLSDAIAEMDEEAGFITHRSHWVSQRHIKDVVFEGRREMLELSTGVRVPVSRTYRPVLVAAGLLPEVKEVTVPPLTQQSRETQKET